MEDVRVSAVQMNGKLGEKADNLDRLKAWARRAASEGAELVLFPELVITGHWISGEVWKIAEEVPDGGSVSELRDLSKELGIFISAGIAEIDRGVVYNTQFIVGHGEYIGKSRKLHMSRDEYFTYRVGYTLPVFDIGKCKVGISICYDNCFPETSRILAIKGAEVLLAPHAARCGRWEGEDGEREKVEGHWKSVGKIYPARASDNGLYLVYANQAGWAGEDIYHAGCSFILDPFGEMIARWEGGRIAEGMVTATLSAERMAGKRGSAGFTLRVRRPEIYREIAELPE